jgi:protein TonB
MGKLQHYAALGFAALLLASCGREPPRSEAPRRTIEIPPTPLPAEEALPSKGLPPISTIDDYKRVLAERIMEATPGAAFRGPIPPLLTAIVVIQVHIDHDGAIVDLHVARARDQKAAGIALAAMRQVAPYPKPGKLLPAHHKTLEFSETFLFNKEYRYQLRTVAPVQ